MADAVLFLPERCCPSCEVYWSRVGGRHCWVCGADAEPSRALWEPTAEELANARFRRLLRNRFWETP